MLLKLPMVSEKLKLLVTLLAVESGSLLLLRRPELRPPFWVIALLNTIFKSWALLHPMSVDSVKKFWKMQSKFCVIVKLLPRSGGITLAYNLEPAELSYISPKVVVA